MLTKYYKKQQRNANINIFLWKLFLRTMLKSSQKNLKQESFKSTLIMKFKKFLEPETIGNCFHFKLQFERWTRLQHEKLKKNVNFYLNLMFEIMSGIPTFYYLIFYFLLFIVVSFCCCCCCCWVLRWTLLAIFFHYWIYYNQSGEL